jgi:hypothetical protein
MQSEGECVIMAPQNQVHEEAEEQECSRFEVKANIDIFNLPTAEEYSNDLKVEEGYHSLKDVCFPLFLMNVTSSP